MVMICFSVLMGCGDHILPKSADDSSKKNTDIQIHATPVDTYLNVIDSSFKSDITIRDSLNALVPDYLPEN